MRGALLLTRHHEYFCTERFTSGRGKRALYSLSRPEYTCFISNGVIVSSQQIAYTLPQLFPHTNLFYHEGLGAHTIKTMEGGGAEVVR